MSLSTCIIIFLKGIEHAINEFLDALTELEEGEWIETDYGFEVTES